MDDKRFFCVLKSIFICIDACSLVHHKILSYFSKKFLEFQFIMVNYLSWGMGFISNVLEIGNYILSPIRFVFWMCATCSTVCKQFFGNIFWWRNWKCWRVLCFPIFYSSISLGWILFSVLFHHYKERCMRNIMHKKCESIQSDGLFNPYLEHFGDVVERHLWTKKSTVTFLILMTSYIDENF